MNILYLCDEYPPGRHGGIGTAVQLLAREMVKQGHNVIVAGFYDWGYGEADTDNDEGVNVYRFRRGLASGWFGKQDKIPVRAAYILLKRSGVFQWDIKRSLEKYKLFIEELIVKHNIDIIERPDYNDYIRFCNAYVPIPQFSKPTVIKLHGSLTHIAKGNNITFPPFIWQFEHDILEQARAVCAVSRYAADMAVAYFNYNKEIVVLYNGIDTAVAKPQVPKEPLHVIFTGALTENKGIYQLMKAWNQVVKQLPGARLSIYGKGPVEKVKGYLSPEAMDTVTFYGHVSRADLFRSLSAASLAIFPSYTENFALGPMEAMLAGTAIIYTQRTSGPELIDHGVDGLLIDPDNVDNIAEQLCYLLQNPDICSLFAASALEKMHQKFDISVIAQKHIQYYNSILSAG